MPRFTLLPALLLLSLPSAAQAGPPSTTKPETLPGLRAAAHITRDVYGIAHIRARNKHDLFFLQGYVHAEDRLFQMDATRRQASGTLAELLGPGAIASDVNLRTLGIQRAAVRSLPLLSAYGRAAVEAYTEGVNLYVQTHPLPPEYAALEITRFEPWTVLDTMTVAKSIAFSLSFGLEDIDYTQALLTYQATLGDAAGWALFSEDLWRAQPFDAASTVPDASVPSPRPPKPPCPPHAAGHGPTPKTIAQPRVLPLAREYLHRIRADPVLRRHLDRANRPGSNQWAISGRHTTSGRPLFANDPHLALGTPSTFYPIHLTAGAFDVMGSGFAGVPFVIVGQNRDIAWGSTVNPMDVTDVYAEQLVPDATSPSGYSSLYQGTLEWVIPIPETFRYNQPGNGIADDVVVAPPRSTIGGTFIPPATLVVPRRNQGPIVSLDTGTGAALSVQYTGFSGTRELETFRIWDTARNLDDFLEGLQYFDTGTQNTVYVDRRGNIAYFASSEMPIREDLQAGTVAGAPPWFIREGQGGNEWLPVQNPQPGQAIPYEILPDAEMPHIVNPPAGWVVNANNDPAGTTLDNNPVNQLRPGGGLYYLSPGYDAALRAGRITRLVRDALAGGGRVSFADMKRFQSNVALLDAEYFVPWIVQALERARAAGAEPLLAALATPPVIEAVGRLQAWDFTTPTGIPEGYDADDVAGVPGDDPSPAEISASVAATLYSVWRGQLIREVVDAPIGPLPKPPSQQAVTALRHLLDQFPVAQGRGASGVDFFPLPGGASAEDRRDIAILQALSDGLDRLGGSEFAQVFGGSADQTEYRWGLLHRITFAHPLGSPFSIPPAGGAFPPPLGEAPGIPTDGGFGSVDASHHNARAQSWNEFTFTNGPVNRFVARADRRGVRAESVWPGGTSGVLGSPYYANLLPLWLTNDTIPLLYRKSDLVSQTASVIRFVPARGRN
ncbi:MAG: penicillin acylase family protein [Acidobacteria bacterium]|nr:penicillin acylase family protein [Acidobacteriota bacterium]